ncbi:MAG TPA: peptide ABC transporter substrate-binding protein [Anaerolineaceae bacterium]|mgnify:FL=1|nr:peptide ABC transporter substrate-binding protein [Longilinea sp.]HOD43793.1 peptide ABC transporter substrate-binding protein [Anaerolineaceae bacterium]HOH19822.1 peptide ABC transporter substrate-binding protein [Anaerolineaceae bacterium]
MKKFRWQLIIIFLTGLVVGILLLREQPVVLPFQEPEPVQGGSYTEAVIGSIQRLNPVLDTYHAADRDIDRLIYSRLVTFDDRGLPQPDLAESWGVSADGTVYNITLKADVKWHDGQPLTSDDVLFTIEMMRAGEGVVPDDLRSFWNDVEVVIFDEQNFQFRLPEPFAPFLDYLAFGVLPRHLLGSLTFVEMVDAPFNLQPVGSGPYKFNGLYVEDGAILGVELVANEDYYDQPPFIEKMIFRYYADGSAALQAYREGEVQGIGGIPVEVLPEALKETTLSIYSSRLPEMTLVLFNLQDDSVPFLQESVVRRALLMGINRQYMIDKVFQGQGILADGPIFPGTWAYNESQERVPYDPAWAIDLLRAEDYNLTGVEGTVRVKDDVSMEFSMIYPDTLQHKAMAEQIQSDWAAMGVKVNLEAVPYDQLVLDRLTNRTFQAALVDLNLARTPDPDPYPFWDSVQATGGQNYSQWDDRMASEYLENARVTIDIAERARLYRNFQVLFARELPALPLFYPVFNYGVNEEIQGVRMGPLFDTSDRFLTIQDWYLVSERNSKPQPTNTLVQ